MARFVGLLAKLRRKYQTLLQPASFAAERGLLWHGAVAGESVSRDVRRSNTMIESLLPVITDILK